MARLLSSYVCVTDEALLSTLCHFCTLKLCEQEICLVVRLAQLNICIVFRTIDVS